MSFSTRDGVHNTSVPPLYYIKWRCTVYAARCLVESTGYNILHKDLNGARRRGVRMIVTEQVLVLLNSSFPMRKLITRRLGDEV